MNPELRRNLWLEMSPHRVIAMPVVLGIGFLVVASLSDAPAGENVAWIALAAFFMMTVFWGTGLAAGAISDEVRGKTWDLQRMSALGPWDMTWGKLCGATVFAWYGGIFCLAIHVYSTRDLPQAAGVKTALAFAAVAVLLQAFAMAATLQSAQKGWTAGTRWYIFLPLALVFVLGPTLGSHSVRQGTLLWGGVEFSSLDFLLVSAVVFAAWTVFGAYRAMCQELQVRTTPLAWGAFTVFLSIYLAGFMIGRPGAPAGVFGYLSLSGLLVSIALTYLMLFSEPNSPMTVRRLLLRRRARQWRRLFEEMPCWPVTFALSCVFAAGTMAFTAAQSENMEMLHRIALMPLVFVFLLARDAAILLYFTFAPQARRVEAATLVYLVMLYWLLPGIFRMADFDTLSDLILPVLINPGLGSLLACAQAAIAVCLCVARWRKNFGG